MALSAQAVALDVSRNRIFVVQDDSYGRPGFEVAVVDGSTNSLIARIPISGNVYGDYGITVHEAAGRVCVANGFGVVVIDADSLAVLSTIGLPFGVTTVAINPAANRIYANFSFTGIAAIDATSYAVVGTTFLSSIPRDLEIDATTGRVFATHESAGFLSVIDGVSLAVTKVPVVGRIVAAASDAALGHLYVADNTLTTSATTSVFDPASLALLGAFTVGGRCEGIVADPGTHRVYAGTGNIQSGVTITDGVTLALIGFVPTSHLAARGAAIDPLRHRVYVASGEVEPQSAIIVIDDPPPDADVSVAATASPAAPVTGTSATWTITVANAGPAVATNLVVTTTLAPGLTFTTCSGGITCSAEGGTVTTTIASLAPGASQGITIAATVGCGNPDATRLVATAVVGADTPDSNGANNTTTASVVASNPPPAFQCPADLTATLPLNATSMPIAYAVPSASDNCPGAVVTCAPASGSTFTAGATTVTCTATDAGSRSTACSFTVTAQTPQQTTQAITQGITQLANQGAITAGQSSALAAKLQAAIDQLNRGNVGAALSQLRAFVNQVRAMVTAGTLTAAEGQPLIDQANALITMLTG